MDRIHPHQVREERQAGAHDVCPIRVPSNEARFDSGDKECQRGQQDPVRASDSPFRCVDRAPRPRANEHDLMPPSRTCGGHGNAAPGEPELGTSHGSGRNDDAGSAGPSPSLLCEDRELSFLTDAEAQILNDLAFCEQQLLNAQVDMDYDFQPEVIHHSFHRTCQRFTKQFQAEFHAVARKLQGKRYQIQTPKLDVLEIMCSSESELVKQADLLGGRARRFGLAEGDLNTVSGRAKLFEWLILYKPEHVWYSPECGPWGKWSQFNMEKSLQGFAEGMEKRRASLWQIALAVVLYQYQSSRQKHFHLEQPDGSHMLNQPSLQEIQAGTQECCFDLCKLGDLTDPETHLPIRKRLRVLTTSQALFLAIHGRMCSKEHEHRQIAGSTTFKGQRVALSTFTEWYPRKFARQVARVLLQSIHKEHPIYAIRAEPPHKEVSEHPTKKRRLRSKLSPADIALRFASVNWQTVMEMTDETAPRVGPLVLENGSLFEKVQQMCPNHRVVHLVLCRGTDRYVGPTKSIPKGVAPLRKRICIRRRHEDLDVDEEWEAWERLTFKGLRRKGVPARVSLTIFAAAKLPDQRGTEMQASQTPSSADMPQAHDVPEAELPAAKRARQDHAEEPIVNPEAMNNPDRTVVDLASQKHGPKFVALKPETQAWLLKVHRNLGHPGAQKLATFCKQLGCPDEMVRAISDLKCSTCVENAVPAISRPSAIHEESDFGDVVSIDGVTWTNRNGTQFHIYHMLDQSTLYHTAVVTPAHSAEQAILALNRGWMQWAGPPNLLCMDAGTEFNSEEFMGFLQKHGIRHRTIATDAQWQNSRIERHGAILQSILSKMDTEEAIGDHASLEVAVSMAMHTKNQWSRHRGYSPEMLVFGKASKVPGSVSSDESSASHLTASNPTPDGLRFRAELAVRERARKAFSETDNSQVIRRALVQRSRPFRGNFMQGDHVMMWKKKGEANGTWVGPLRVIIQEGAQIVWVTMGQKLFRVAPEHLRPMSAVEEWKGQHTDNPNSFHFTSPHTTSNNFQSILPPHGGTQYHNLTNVHAEIPADATTPEIPSGSAPNPDHNSQNNFPRPSHSNQSVISINSDQPDQEPNPNDPNAPMPGVMIPDPNVPVEVPVPDADDDLFAEAERAFHVTEDQGWKFEVNISNYDIHKWREETKPQEMAFLVSAAKRQRSEVKLTNLTPEDREKFQQAKLKEINSWITTETIAKITRNKIPRENVMRCRWILTWKEVDEASSTNVPKKYAPKARLVVLGFEDP